MDRHFDVGWIIRITGIVGTKFGKRLLDFVKIEFKRLQVILRPIATNSNNVEFDGFVELIVILVQHIERFPRERIRASAFLEDSAKVPSIVDCLY